MYGPPPRRNIDAGEEKPKSIKEMPGYFARVVKGFFSRYIYIFKLVWETSPAILFVMSFTAIFNGIFPVLGAYITAQLLESIATAYNVSQQMIVDITSDEALNGIIFWIVLEFVYLISKSILGNIYSTIISISGEKVSNHIKVKIITKAKSIDVSQFDMPEFYEKFENASREASFRPIQILQTTFNMISNIISMLSFIIALFALSPFAPLIIIVFALPAAIVKFVYGRKNFLYMRRSSKERRHMEYYSRLMTNKDLVKEIRIFNLSDTFISKFKETFARYYKGLKKLILQENTWHIIIAIVTALVNSALFLYVGYQVWLGNLKLGDYSFYSGSLTSIISCVSAIVTSTATIYQGTLFIDNMIEFNNLETKIVPNVTPALDVKRHIPHEIEFKDVCFSYPGSETLVLKNVSFKLNAGTTTVLVGLNGAGKTTIIKLLTRLYDPTSGTILLDGVDIRNYDLNQLYRIYGTIFQDFGKYAVTARENIYYGNVNADIDQNSIISSAESSGADAFISKMPKSYDTPLMKYFEDDGVELSIGQWQKLSVARAFYSDSDIMILDEPTASLDALAEQQIFQQFEKLTEGKTSIFVSHRLSSATTADNIIVLEHGHVIEQGTHKELMQTGGKYFELFSTQAKRYLENE
ncbi:MAG: ABC transporter ATP-binding protein [Ruminococcaceae bacterium]|nr:ABC transporter ATP-binding protein [Oscillospiraceae bacterium]